MFSKPRSKSSRGLTLVEILIALAILVVSAFIVWPVIRGAFDIHKLKDAGRRLQEVCTDARLRAVASGQIHVFRFQADGRRYLVEAVPLANLDNLMDFTDLDEPTGDIRPEAEIDWTLEGESLPEGAYFVTVENRSDERDLMLTDILPGEELVEEQKPLMFYPDGTCSNATIILRSEEGRFLEVTLDGLTGGVLVGEPFKTKTVESELK